MELNRKNIITFVIVIFFSILFIWIGNRTNQTQILDDTAQNYFRGKVVSIENIEVHQKQITETSSVSITTITYKQKLLTGPNRGKTVLGVQTIDGSYAIKQVPIKVGNKIITYFEPEASGIPSEYTFAEYYRSDGMIFLVVLFLLLIVLIGKSKGFFTILSLIITVLVIFCVFIPAIINGRNVYITTIVVSSFIIFTTLLLINGWNKKTLCAILGNLGGIAVAGIIAILMSKILKVNGFVDEEYAFLVAAQLNKPLDLIGIVWSGIVLGSLGAVMDVAMSISSAMNELSENMEKKTAKKMMKSGMNIGRDAIGTMTNTLILAYVGSSIATVVLLSIYNNNMLFLFNTEMIVVEVLQSIVGSLGILFAVPLTALFAAYIFTKNDEDYKYIKKDEIGGIKL